MKPQLTEPPTSSHPIRVAVHDPLPLYRVGVMRSLAEAGLDPEAPSDLLAWTRSADVRIILLTLCRGADWQLLTQLCEEVPVPLVIALLEEDGIAAYVRAIRAGATVALPRATNPDQLQKVFLAAASGSVMLPRAVVRALIDAPTSEPDNPVPSAREQQWLQELADGATVGHLAKRAGYSERMMFRLLGQLYHKLGAQSRTETLILAKERGWL